MTINGYLVEGALQVARRLADGYSDAQFIDRDLRHAATEGRWPAHQLERVRALLVRVDLFETDDKQRLIPAAPLRAIAALPDVEAIPALSLLLESLVGDVVPEGTTREEVGARAEQFVVDECQRQLRALARDDLAARVSQVSMISDRFGYDVSTPTLDGPVCHLEVKGSTAASGHLFTFFLSRNEYDVGRRDPDWSLVACLVADGDVQVLGHLVTAHPLDPYVPDDRNGRWTEAMVRLPKHLLSSGLPSAVP